MRSVDPQTYLGSAYTGEMSLMCVTPVVASMQVRKRLSEGEDSSGRRVKSRPSGTSTPPTPQDDTEAFATEGNRDGKLNVAESRPDGQGRGRHSSLQVTAILRRTLRRCKWGTRAMSRSAKSIGNRSCWVSPSIWISDPSILP